MESLNTGNNKQHQKHQFNSEAQQNQSPQEEVAKEAYAIYQKEGCPQGCAEQHWLQAEEKLKHKSNQAKYSSQQH